MKMTHPATERVIEVSDDRAANYVRQGWREAESDAPKGNAPLTDWQEFARERGFSDEDIEGKSRADLRAALS